MVLWDSRLLHCNIPGFHPYDEMDLRTALEDVGLPDASPEPCFLCSIRIYMTLGHDMALAEYDAQLSRASRHGKRKEAHLNYFIFHYSSLIK